MFCMADEAPLKNGLEHGFVDSGVLAQEKFIPQFVVNDPDKEEKVLVSLKKELMNCNWFEFSVAFITYGGINTLLYELRELQKRGVRGKIIASQYQNFTQPQALRRLALFDNIELRIVTSEKKMHTKCYIFGQGEGCDVIIGSSNLTADALCSNMEWNLRFNSRESGDLTANILKEFNEVFASATPVTPEWIKTYESIYDAAKSIRKAIEAKDISAAETGKILPNKMQQEALDNLEEIRKSGSDRALVISATGSGKTYLSAMDAHRFGGKVLYIVHRNPIIEKSMLGYRNVYGPAARIIRYDPDVNDLTADVTFCTVQTMSKKEILHQIPSNTFDYILIDEVHHAGAETYQRIIAHFKPRFLLGMTATPDRTDGYDIYELFHHSIAYDIRLKDAMEMNLICPFHYFGIASLEVDDDEYDDKSKFSKTQIEEKTKHVMAEADFYGHSGDRVKGLIFCTRIKEAEDLSEELNRHGLRTEAVSGKTSGDEVEKAITRLESDELDDPLDYIVTADLFNEGVDIPAVNQIIMLRPTESPIIYIQQLGRGLRLHQNKEFVVVLDFIGNYEKNFNIPVALSGDRSFNRADTRKFVESGDGMLPGNSTISFDEVSKSRIFKAIDCKKFGDKKTIREDYLNLRRKLGRLPRLNEFYKYGSIDPVRIIDSYDSYPKFLNDIRDPDAPVFTDAKMMVLKFISKLISPGKRLREIDLLEEIIHGAYDLNSTITKMYPDLGPLARKNLINIFEGRFFSNKIALVVGNSIEPAFANMLKDPTFTDQVEQIIEIGRRNHKELYSQTVEGTDLVLFAQYSYVDVCRFLRFDKAQPPNNMGGYYFDKSTRTFPIFVNYVKGDDVKESQRYDDRFENRSTLIALSKSTEGKDSKRMKMIENSDADGVAIHLFVRKSKIGTTNKDKDFYYLGRMHFVEFLEGDKPAKVRYRLENEVRQDIYDYLTMPDIDHPSEG